MLLKETFLCFFLTVLVALNSHALNKEPLTGPVILTISGAINADSSQELTQNNAEKSNVVQFDLATIEKIGLTKVVTETPWNEGLVEFEGVLMRDLLAHVTAQGSSVYASALDNYSVDIPIEDFMSHDVILATRIDGKVLRVRDNGPLWVIYPWTDHSEYKRPHYFARSIWQLKSLTVNE